MDTATLLAAASVAGVCVSSFVLGMLFYRFMHRPQIRPSALHLYRTHLLINQTPQHTRRKTK